MGNLHSPMVQHYWSLTIKFLVSYPGYSLWGLISPQRSSRCIDGSRIFGWVARSSTIKQGQVGLKTGDTETVLQAIEANPVSSTWRVSGELSISQFNEVCLVHDLGENIRSYRNVSCATKIYHYLRGQWKRLTDLVNKDKFINDFHCLTINVFTVLLRSWDDVLSCSQSSRANISSLTL